MGVWPASTQTEPLEAKTEVIYGNEAFLEIVYDFFKKTEYRLDICAVAIPPREINNRINELYYAVSDRGGRLRLVTEINNENLDYLKSMANRVQIRHVYGIGGNFAVSDHEYLATLGTPEFSPGGKLLYSSEETVVRHHQALFDALWERGVP